VKILSRIALAAALALGLGLAVRQPADAVLCTVPYVFNSGTIINATPFNSNFSALQACGNSIDNSNIGSAGLYASNLLPTTSGQATFGGLQPYTFPNSLTANAGSTTVVPVTANGASGQTADLADYDVNGSKLAWFDSAGVLHGPSAAFSSGLTSPSFSATGSVTAGSATAPAGASGDVIASRSTTAGSLDLGGSTSSATIDYGATTGGTVTVSKPLAVTGTIAATGAVSGTTLSPTAGTLTAIGWGSCVTTPNCALGLNVAMYNTSYRCQLTVNNTSGPSTVFAYIVASTSTISVYGPTGYTIQALCYE
jgi:hypothetical protein